MSLLIKALDKAQNAKTEQVQSDNAKKKQSDKPIGAVETDLVLSLSPTNSATADSGKAGVAASKNGIKSSVIPPASNVSSKSAANVFSSKGVEANNGNKRLALIAGAGLLSLLAMGAYFYQFVDSTPDIVIPPKPVALQPAPEQMQQPAQQVQNNIDASVTAQAEVEPAENTQKVAVEPPKTMMPDEVLMDMQAKPTKKSQKKSVMVEDEAFANVENTVEVSDSSVSSTPTKKTGKSKTLQFGKAIASDSVSINVTKTTPQAGVNPILMSAYEAYGAGKDSEAQKLYKQVLQQDVRNVDALLGLGAIASRQGREADANGWYGKVLEVDPRNNLALAALINSQPQGNELSNESHLKSMLAKQPDDANLYVALGNLYAEQNQWSAAQQAYFDAYRLHSSADNAFNLAVSLDQLGKSKLALPYYLRALELAQTGANGIDKAALEARIAAIQ